MIKSAISVRTLAVAAVLMAQLPSQTLAQGGVETFQDWSVTCSGAGQERVCSVIQDQSAPDNSRLLAMEVRLASDGQPAAVLLLPFGLGLGRGVDFRVIGAQLSTKSDFVTCVPTGCIASFPITAPMMLDLKTKRAAEIVVHDMAGAQLVYQVSLMGLTVALDRLAMLQSGG